MSPECRHGNYLSLVWVLLAGNRMFWLTASLSPQCLCWSDAIRLFITWHLRKKKNVCNVPSNNLMISMKFFEEPPLMSAGTILNLISSVESNETLTSNNWNSFAFKLLWCSQTFLRSAFLWHGFINRSINVYWHSVSQWVCLAAVLFNILYTAVPMCQTP